MLQNGLKLPLRPLHAISSQLLARGGARDSYFQEDSPQYNNIYRSAPFTYSQSPVSRTGSFQLKNQRQIGITMLGIGFALTALGVMLFFEKTLLKFGNIFFLAGLSLFIGPERVVSFFMQPHRLRATIIVLLGSFLVFTGRPRMGILCQIFGLLNLFGNMFPLLLAMGKQVPIIGDILRVFDNKGRTASSRPPYYDYDRAGPPKYYPEF